MSITEYGVPVPRPDGPDGPDGPHRDPARPGPPPQRDRGPRGTRPVGWGLALIGAGVLWILSLAGVDIRWDLIVPIALIGIGLLLAIGARWGTGGGLLGLGIVLTIVAIVTAALPVSASAGDRDLTITEIAELEPSYSLGVGNLTLDLRDVELPPGTTELAARVTLGELVIQVPDRVAVTGQASATIGEVVGFDRTSGGVGSSIRLAGDGPDGPILDLDLRAGIGRIEVTR